MPLKLYQRRGALLKGKSIEMPTPEKKAPNIWGSILDDVSKKTAKLSAENYALGRATLINGVLNNAYEQAPDNPKRFDELVKSGFDKGLNGLDDEVKNDIYALANDKVKMLQIKVGNNLNKRLDAENTQRITELANDALYGENGIQSTNALISEYLTTGKDINNQPVTKETMDALINQRNKQISRLKAMSKAKNLRGNYIINDKSLRKAIETEKFGISDQILDDVSLMSYDTLKEFDENIFQDMQGFMDRAGISKEEYAYMDKNIKKRRKELQADDERIVSSQAEFNAITAIYRKSPEALEDMKDRLDKKTYNKYSELLTQPTKKQEFLITNEDVDLLHQFNNVIEVADTKYNGNKNYNDEFITKMVDAEYGLKKYRERYGSNDRIDDITDNIMYNAATDSMYGDVIGSFADSSAFGIVVKGHKIPKAPDVTKMDIAQYMKASEERMLKEATLPIDPNPEETLAAERSIASEALKAQVAFGNMMKRTKDEGTRQQIYDQIKNIKTVANKEIIKRKMRPLIDDSEFDRCMKELQEGKKPIFKNKFNGKVYKFIAITDKDLIISD